jgi:hypothetical protein
MYLIGLRVSALRAFASGMVLATGAFDPGIGFASPSGLKPIGARIDILVHRLRGLAI